MLFNSYAFWIFFCVILVLYNLLKPRKQNMLLLGASYFFYGYWNWRYLLLLLLCTAISYCSALLINKNKISINRKLILTLCISVNILILGFFKYYNFFETQVNQLLCIAGLPPSIPYLNIILPVGISFFIFQGLSFSIDVYNKKIEKLPSFMDFALYLSFFPQLIAGPIERSENLLPQIQGPRKKGKNDLIIGFYYVISGLFKKVIVADNMAPMVNHIFSLNTNQTSGFEILISTYAFAFQIYGDFSGYSSIAQGIAKWMGFDLSHNFRMPYFAVTPGDFWRRWHITLSTWLRDYIYIPLGGKRKGKKRAYANLLITMIIGGLWHGAGWTYIVWGLFHGGIQIIYKLFGINPDIAKKPAGIIKRCTLMFLSFNLICLSWLFFRAENLNQVYLMLIDVFTDFRLTELTLYMMGLILFLTIPLIVLEIAVEKSGDLLWLTQKKAAYQIAIYSYMIFMIWVFPPLKNQVFIYFQF